MLQVWFADYLSNHSQFVILQGISSPPPPPHVKLLLSFVNGHFLAPCCLCWPWTLTPNHHLRWHLLLQADLPRRRNTSSASWCRHHCVEWIESKGLSIDKAKTKSLVISRKLHPPSPSVMLNGAQIEQVSAFRYLGVTINDKQSWTNHIDLACAKV